MIHQGMVSALFLLVLDLHKGNKTNEALVNAP